MVVAFHCFGLTYGRWQLPWQPHGLRATLHAPGERLSWTFLAMYPAALGWTGVAVFFVLSGFVIHHSQVRAGPGPMDVTAYAGRRFLRIYPPYLLAAVVFAAVDFWAGGADRTAVLRQLLYHATLLHNLRADTYWGLDGSLWSLAVEVQCYALYPLLWWVRRRSTAVTPLLLTAAVSIAWWAWAAWGVRWRAVDEPSAFIWWNTPMLWSSWTLGMFLADRFAAGRRAFARPVATGLTLAVAAAAATLFKPAWPFAFPLAAGAGAVVVERALWSDRWDWIGNRSLVGVGLISYTLYLWHQPLLPPVLRVVNRLGGSPGVRFPVLFATGVAVTGLVSVALHAAVERPSQRLARRFAARP